MAVQPRSRIGEGFDIDKIHSGRLYRPGSFSSRRRVGLAGAMRKLKTSSLRLTEAKNLSKDDLKIFHKLIGEKLDKAPAFSPGLNRYARRDIMHQAEHLARKGIITREDKKDLKNMVGALSNKRPTEEISAAAADGALPAADNVAGSNLASVGSRMTPVPLASSPILRSGLAPKAQFSSPGTEHLEASGHSAEPEVKSDEEAADSKHSAPTPAPPHESLPDIDFE